MGPLGAVLGPLGTVSLGYVATMQFQKKMGFDLGPILRPKRLPKRVQNGVQNGQKSSTKFNMKQEGFEDPLGSVLGLSWVVLGSILGSKIVKFRWFYKVSVKIVFLKMIRLRSASWTDLGSILTPKGLPKGFQI